MFSAPGQQRGFSLLELILVLVIIGIILAAVTITITDRRIDELKVEAQRLSALIILAVDEAVMTNQEFGLLFKQEEYQFLVFNEDVWESVNEETSRQFRARQLPEGVLVKISVSGLYGNDDSEQQLILGADDEDEIDEDNIKLQPEIMMLSSAELTPFVIRLAVEEPEPAYMQIKTLPDGSIELTGPIYEPADLGWSTVWQD